MNISVFFIRVFVIYLLFGTALSGAATKDATRITEQSKVLPAVKNLLRTEIKPILAEFLNKPPETFSKSINADDIMRAIDKAKNVSQKLLERIIVELDSGVPLVEIECSTIDLNVHISRLVNQLEGLLSCSKNTCGLDEIEISRQILFSTYFQLHDQLGSEKCLVGAALPLR